jgi:hypothetical protein
VTTLEGLQTGLEEIPGHSIKASQTWSIEDGSDDADRNVSASHVKCEACRRYLLPDVHVDGEIACSSPQRPSQPTSQAIYPAQS